MIYLLEQLCCASELNRGCPIELGVRWVSRFLWYLSILWVLDILILEGLHPIIPCHEKYRFRNFKEVEKSPTSMMMIRLDIIFLILHTITYL